MEKKMIYYYKDLGEIFGKHERTMQRLISKIRLENPKNQSLNRWIGSSWYCTHNDLEEVFRLCSKSKSEKTEEVHSTT